MKNEGKARILNILFLFALSRESPTVIKHFREEAHNSSSVPLCIQTGIKEEAKGKYFSHIRQMRNHKGQISCLKLMAGGCKWPYSSFLSVTAVSWQPAGQCGDG